MTGQVLPLGASVHAAVDTLLPFYVNATLRGEELAFVEEHVRACERCQHEVDWLRKTFAALAADTGLHGAPRVAPPALQHVGDGRRRRNRQRNYGARIAEGLRTSHSWTRWLLAAQLAAIAVLGTLLATDTRDVPSYRTLGVSNSSAQMHDAVAVMFDPSITASEMRRIVLGVGARIVDGPTSTDVYVLEIPAGRTDQALKALRAEGAVRLAERLGPRTGP